MRLLTLVAPLVLIAGVANAQSTCPPVQMVDVLGQINGQVTILEAAPLYEGQQTQEQIQESSGIPGACVNHSQRWTWQGSGCGSSGSNQSLGFAAGNLWAWGCPGGTITKIGGDGAVYSYPSGQRLH